MVPLYRAFTTHALVVLILNPNLCVLSRFSRKPRSLVFATSPLRTQLVEQLPKQLEPILIKIPPVPLMDPHQL